MKMNYKKKLKVIDLFSGCGGLNEGFKQVGFETSVSNDIWEPAKNTFIRNNKDSHFVLGDITEKKVRDNILKFGKGSDVIIGGPPCQAYSMAGARDVDDPRGKLFEDYVKIVEKIKPKYFIIENVKGLLSMHHDRNDLNKEEKIKLDKLKELEIKKNALLLKRKQSKNTSKISFSKSEEDELEIVKEILKSEKSLTSDLRTKVTTTIQNRFYNLGYDVQIKLLNAANFGAPQKRQRVIIIGAKENYPINFPEETFRDNKFDENQLPFKSNLSNWVTVKEAIDDLKNEPENIPFNHIFTKCGELMQNKINNTPIGKSVYGGYSDAYFRCFPDEPSRTVKENHGGVFLHYEKNRFMTPRELARLQTFDDEFIFDGSKSQILVQIGNAVPPILGNSIASKLIEGL